MPPTPAADPIEVRPATPADYAAIADLTVAAYEADGQLEAGDPYAQVLADCAGRGGAGELLVAVDGAEVLGSVLYVEAGSSFAETAGPGDAEFRMLAVSPKRSGGGPASGSSGLPRPRPRARRRAGRDLRPRLRRGAASPVRPVWASCGCPSGTGHRCPGSGWWGCATTCPSGATT
jgi:hypothetical protein